MKKTPCGFIWAVSLALIVGFAACGEKQMQETPTAEHSATGKTDNPLDDYYVLGDQPEQIDVANQGNIKLLFKVKRTALDILPTAKVVNEYGSFECTINWMKLIKTNFDEQANALYLTYGVEIDWFPGSDSSGCEIEIGDPYSGKTYKAGLYMSY